MKIAYFSCTDLNFTNKHYLYSAERFLASVFTKIQPDLTIFNAFNLLTKKGSATEIKDEYGSLRDFMDGRGFGFYVNGGKGRDDLVAIKSVIEDRVLTPEQPRETGITYYPWIFGYSEKPTTEQFQQFKESCPQGNIIVSHKAMDIIDKPDTKEDFSGLTNNIIMFGESKRPDEKYYVYNPEIETTINGNISVKGIISGFKDKKFFENIKTRKTAGFSPFTFSLLNFTDQGILRQVEVYQVDETNKVKLSRTYIYNHNSSNNSTMDEKILSPYSNSTNYPLTRKILEDDSVSKQDYQRLERLLKGAIETNDQKQSDLNRKNLELSLIKEASKLGINLPKDIKKLTPEQRTEVILGMQKKLRREYSPGTFKKLLYAGVIAAGIAMPVSLAYLELNSTRTDLDLAKEHNKNLIIINERKKIVLDEQGKKLIIKDDRIKKLNQENEGLYSKQKELSSLLEEEEEKTSKLDKKSKELINSLDNLTKTATEASNRWDETQTENQNLNKRVEEQLEVLKKANQQVSDSKSEYKKLEKEYQDNKKFLTDKILAKEKEINLLKQQAKISPEEFDTFQKELEKAKKASLKSEEQLITAKRTISEKEKEISELEKKLATVGTPLPEIPEMELTFIKTYTRTDLESLGIKTKDKYTTMDLHQRVAIFYNGEDVIKILTREEIKTPVKLKTKGRTIRPTKIKITPKLKETLFKYLENK